MRDRCILILDDTRGGLGSVALSMVRDGFEVYYSQDPDEACLLGRQEGQRTHALLFSPGVCVSEVRSVRERLGEYTELGPASLAVVGERPEEERLAELRELGVEWALWEPYEPEALAYVARQILSRGGDPDGRTEHRVPAGLSATIWVGTRRHDVRVSDLSLSGAYLAAETIPYEKGALITIEIALPDGPLMAKATVNRRGEGEETLESGTALEFTALRDEDCQRVRAFLVERAQAFCL